LITGIYIVFLVLVIISLGLSRPIISKKHEEMKLLAKEDKKYKKIPNKEKKRGKLCASPYHDETPSWYNGYVQKIKGLVQEK
jgi:hypothetical protein